MARNGKCINPECVKGVTPGVIGIGRGKAGAPLINNGVMTDIPKRWAWVACRACNPDEHAPFIKKNWTPEQIQERARLADAKAPYVSTAPNPKLARIAAATPTPHVSAPPPVNVINVGKIDELTAQIAEMSKKLTDMTEALSKSVTQNLDLSATVGKLSAQVSELLAENARLRTAATVPISPANPSLGSPPAPRKRKSRQIAKPS
jgi:hypothetical protein